MGLSMTFPGDLDVSALVAQYANKVGAATVGFVLPSFGANRELPLVQIDRKSVV